MHRLLWGMICGVVFMFLGAGASNVLACPFCASTSRTLSEEFETMDAVVVARLVQAPPPSQPDEAKGAELPRAKFEIVKVIKGGKLIAEKQPIEAIYLGSGKPGQLFLIEGIVSPKLLWSTPIGVSQRAQDYIVQLAALPKEGKDPEEGKKRFYFFLNFLEDKDELLARDAYDEFAKASYATVRAIKDRLNHEQLIAWIKNSEIPVSRRRLYMVMLGVCGTDQDAPLLEEWITSSDRKVKAGLDAMIACYLTLKGEAGLQLIDKLYLKNAKAEYADTYSAIMALRFHTSEGNVIEKKRVLASLRLMLERPDLADLVIPDLAKWEDWSAMDQLMELYRSADKQKNSWVRVPTIMYLRSCPLPKAAQYLEECKQLDPTAVQRASAFTTSPAGGGPAGATAAPPKSSQLETPRLPANSSSGNGSSEGRTVAFEAPIPVPDDSLEVSAPPSAAIAAESASQTNQESVAAAPARLPGSTAVKPLLGKEVASLNRGAAPAKALKSPAQPPNLFYVIGVPWMAGIALLIVQWSILRGGPRKR